MDRDALRRELERVRERGYATIVDELGPGLAAVASPVFERDGSVIAALSVSGATLRLAPHRLQILGLVCVEQASEVSARL